MHQFDKQRALFKAYDIRGNTALFTAEFIKALSQAFAQHFVDIANAKTVVIGYDVRHCSEHIAESIAEQCQAFGLQVIWLGMVTTPVMAFWANQFEGHGIIATASHSESHIAGVKWLTAGESPDEASIQALYQQLIASTSTSQWSVNSSLNSSLNSSVTATDQPPSINNNLIALSPNHVSNAYIQSMQQAMDAIHNQRLERLELQTSIPHQQRLATAKPLKVVIDCMNGATGQFALNLFSQHTRLCSEVIVLNHTPNADFPKGNPDPMEDNRLTELSHAVIEYQADLGLAFDGDGDRLMVIDNQGNPLLPDHLLYLLARIAIEDNATSAYSNASESVPKPPTIIFDVKCSHHLPRLIHKLGATPEMSRTGSSVLRRALQTKCETRLDDLNHQNTDKRNMDGVCQKLNSNININSESAKPQVLFAGELSGHFLFNDGHFLLHDDAMYAGLRLVSWLQHQAVLGRASCLTDIVNTLPSMVSTADIYLPLKYYESPQLINHADKDPKSLLHKLSHLCDRLSNHSFELPEGAHLTCIDGLRLDFSHGFGIIRPSNTSNSLTVRFVGDSAADLKKVQGYFVKLCQYLNSDLAKQVANITVKT